MKTLAKLYRGQYRVVEEAVESWKADHDAAMAACDIEEIIGICIGINFRVAEWARVLWDTGFQGKVGNPEESGKSLLKVLKAGAEAWQALVEGVEDYTARGYVLENAGRVPAARAKMQALHDDFAVRWPFIRKEDVERGAGEIVAGKCVTGEELLRELQGNRS
jgi:hypothetical protein